MQNVDEGNNIAGNPAGLNSESSLKQEKLSVQCCGFFLTFERRGL